MSITYRVDADGQYRFTVVIHENGLDNILIEDVPYHYLQLAMLFIDSFYDQLEEE